MNLIIKISVKTPQEKFIFCPLLPDELLLEIGEVIIRQTGLYFFLINFHSYLGTTLISQNSF